jgi:hypothetical protein
MYIKTLLFNTHTESFQSDRTGINDQTKGFSGKGIPSQPIHPELSADNFGLTEHEAIFQLQRRLMMK